MGMNIWLTDPSNNSQKVQQQQQQQQNALCITKHKQTFLNEIKF